MWFGRWTMWFGRKRSGLRGWLDVVWEDIDVVWEVFIMPERLPLCPEVEIWKNKTISGISGSWVIFTASIIKSLKTPFKSNFVNVENFYTQMWQIPTKEMCLIPTRQTRLIPTKETCLIPTSKWVIEAPPELKNIKWMGIKQHNLHCLYHNFSEL